MTTLTIRSVPITFPYPTLYNVQRVYMERVLEALQSHTHALLESPTGTGKTLALLCATRAWQDAERSVGHNVIIVYASRTHAQLEQVYKEYKRTVYYENSNCVLLGSRDTSCSNAEVNLKKGVELISACRKLVGARKCGKRTRTLSVVGNLRIPDIEDAVKQGVEHGYCPYYFNRDPQVLKRMHVVFMPYNYLVDSSQRQIAGIDWNNAVVVVDEAHNIEDVAQESASFAMTGLQLQQIIGEIDRNQSRSAVDSNSCRGVLVQLNRVLDERSRSGDIPVPKQGGGAGDEQIHHQPGSEIFTLFAKAGINSATYASLVETLEKLSDELGMLGKAAEALSHFFSQIFLLNLDQKSDRDAAFASSKRAADEYFRISVNRGGVNQAFQLKQGEDGNGSGTATPRPSTLTTGPISWKLNFWCFSPGFAMKDLVSRGVKTIIMTSGTLTPIDTFATSMRVSFPVRLENPHVVKDDRLWLGVISKGVTGQVLNGSFANRDNVQYQEELGRTIVALCRVLPDGVLVFFPSHAVMQSCMRTWQARDIWDRLRKTKGQVVSEDRSAFDQEVLMKRFDEGVASGQGSLLFAVCRGRASEGMDFRDNRARGVIIVGLPFPPRNDVWVVHKRAYMDEARASNGSQTMSGQTWYTQQAYRAINQAVGRVIRHEFDFGAIVLLDERFAGIRPHLCMWLRSFFKTHDTFGDAISGLATFFKNVKVESAFEIPSRVATAAGLKPATAPPYLVQQNAPLVYPKRVQLEYQVAQTVHNKNPLMRAGVVTATVAATLAAKNANPLTRASGATASWQGSATAASATPAKPPYASTSVSSTSVSSTTFVPPSSSSGRDTVDFLTSCKAALSENSYFEFKTILKSYHTLARDAPPSTLNRRVLTLFSSIQPAEQRVALLRTFAGYLPSRISRSFCLDVGLIL